MSRLNFLQRVLGSTPVPTPSVAPALSTASSTLRFRTIDTNFSTVKEGDRVILHGKNPLLTKVLKSGEKHQVSTGTVEHDSIIGKRPRDKVQMRKGPPVRFSFPTLEEYVSLVPRLVTPIYPQDANLITSLLDLHVNTPAEGETQPPLEILESGTGHGSLTLHLARAIHAANTTPPPLPKRSQIKFIEGRIKGPDEKDGPKETTEPVSDPVQEEWDAWRAQRNAIIHTVDTGAKFSALAEKNVKGFRRGMYAGNVDFYVGPVESWAAQQKELRKTEQGSEGSTVEPFVSHVILDMPSSNLRIPHVTPIMKRDGLLVVFMPSITQIGECLKLIKDQNLPLVQEKVIELGNGISGGRQWDVRYATKKSSSDPASWATSSETEGSASEAEETSDTDSSEVVVPEQPPKEESVLVCRPKVGVRIQGGGFVGVWRRIEDH
ncbi:unnamed protein product [Penicillium olsonii]|uniref:tRNA (adenine(58)-N(1))-methyltransferase catalytic subunit TRM61 n=1 Tax=Penicillium olsonii TaxID=99116 RepID=A0A9W4MWT1_PENOL|nr:unnamed protein product [Penicillium olsonii]CAG8194807.1 unnamed protein product [Penicillium olsonii]CAG8201848.1 unnamed protein product [Penicillium olsonii]